MFYFSLPIFCNAQTTIERQYFSAMKKHITWNSVQNCVTETVKNHSCVCRQPSICLLCKTWQRMLCHRPVYWDDFRVVWILRTTWCSWRAPCCKEQYREFAL